MTLEPSNEDFDERLFKRTGMVFMIDQDMNTYALIVICCTLALIVTAVWLARDKKPNLNTYPHPLNDPGYQEYIGEKLNNIADKMKPKEELDDDKTPIGYMLEKDPEKYQQKRKTCNKCLKPLLDPNEWEANDLFRKVYCECPKLPEPPKDKTELEILSQDLERLENKIDANQQELKNIILSHSDRMARRLDQKNHMQELAKKLKEFS